VNNRLHHWLPVFWPVALLILFGAVFRGPASDARRSDTAADCETAPADNVSELERCVEGVPDDMEPMIALGAAYESAGRLRDAERLYRRALAVDPRDGDVHLRLGEVLLRLGDGRAARSEAEAAAARQPGNPAAIDLIERSASGAGR
jgi:cytochrome c-type biogenesis protein CcmH/NrfG